MALGLQHILDGRGFEIAATGLTIVFCALTLIALFITVLPRCLKTLAVWIPEGDHDVRPAPPQAGSEADLVAAIAVALHHRRTRS